MAEEGWEMKWELLVADAWADPDLKQRLLKDPMGVCKERGIVPPQGMKIKIVEDTDEVAHFVLPSKPSEEELSAEELESVAGGQTTLCITLCIGGCGCRGCGGGPCGGGCAPPCGGCGGGCRPPGCRGCGPPCAGCRGCGPGCRP